MSLGRSRTGGEREWSTRFFCLYLTYKLTMRTCILYWDYASNLTVSSQRKILCDRPTVVFNRYGTIFETRNSLPHISEKFMSSFENLLKNQPDQNTLQNKQFICFLRTKYFVSVTGVTPVNFFQLSNDDIKSTMYCRNVWYN